MRKEKYKLYEERALRFLTRLQSGIVLEKNIQLHAEYFKSDQQIPWSKKEKGSFKKISKGEIWGTEWDSAWFHITGSIPTEWITSKSLVAHLGFGGEACIFDSKGCPLFGLTAGSVFSCHFGKDIYWIDQSMISNNSIDLWVEVSASGLFGVKPESFLPAENLQNEYKFKALVTNLQLAVFDTKMWHFMLDFEILLNLMQTLPESTPRRSRILYVLNKLI